MAPDPRLVAFGELLAQTTDGAERARILAQAKQRGLQQAPEEAFEAPISPLREYLERPIEIPPVLVHPTFLVRGGVNTTVGRAGKGKTVMNLNRCLRWAAGKPMFDGWKDADSGDAFFAPEQPLRILVVENEGAAGMFHRQIGIMLNASDFLSDEDRERAKDNILIWGDGGYSSLKLDDPNKLNGLRAGIEQHKPDAVFIEPFRSLYSGEENSSTEMSIVLDHLQNIASFYDCGVMVSHHERKGGAGEDGEKMSQARGSTAFEGLVAVMENFESVKAGEQRELSWSKVRYQDPDRKFPSPVRMEWVPDSWWYEWVPTSALEDAILGALGDNDDEPMTSRDLADALDERQNKLNTVLKRLKDEGRVRRMPSVPSGGGTTGYRWRLPSSDVDGYGGAPV